MHAGKKIIVEPKSYKFTYLDLKGPEVHYKNPVLYWKILDFFLS